MHALIELAREELAAVVAGDWELLDGIAERRAAALGALPDRLDERLAHDVLRAHEAIDAALRDRMAAVGRELRGLDHSRDAARAYGEH